jgi:hypothetical protein
MTFTDLQCGPPTTGALNQGDPPISAPSATDPRVEGRVGARKVSAAASGWCVFLEPKGRNNELGCHVGQENGEGLVRTQPNSWLRVLLIKSSLRSRMLSSSSGLELVTTTQTAIRRSSRCCGSLVRVRIL